ncbi:hypothetical protein JCM9957A_42280 [Kineosporia succinea]
MSPERASRSDFDAHQARTGWLRAKNGQFGGVGDPVIRASRQLDSHFRLTYTYGWLRGVADRIRSEIDIRYERDKNGPRFALRQPYEGRPEMTAVRALPRGDFEVRFLTVAEVAGIMRVSKMTVYRLVHAGELAAMRVGRSYRVPERAVQEYLRHSYMSGAGETA